MTKDNTILVIRINVLYAMKKNLKKWMFKDLWRSSKYKKSMNIYNECMQYFRNIRKKSAFWTYILNDLRIPKNWNNKSSFQTK